jgi:hypothetical protein
VTPLRLLPLLILPLLAGCSDERASFHIDGSEHNLTLIRQQQFFWEKKADYILVAARMPDCMRRHRLGQAGLDARVEVYAPGNNAWIIRQGKRMYVTETRTCEGFAKLDAEPEGGLGPLVGTFRNRDGTLAFIPAEAAAGASGTPTGMPPAAASR